MGRGIGASGSDPGGKYYRPRNSGAGCFDTEDVTMNVSVRSPLPVNIAPPSGSLPTREMPSAASMRMTVSHVNFFYGAKQSLFDISLGIASNKVTALIGPSGCGKSTLLRN